MRRWLALSAAGLFVAGCGGGGDDPLPASGPAPGPVSPPAIVAGRWQIQAPTNADSARATDCTGDATALDGQTAAQLLIPNDAGLDALGGVFLVRQDRDTFSFERAPIPCAAGGQGSESGGGTVRGSELEGHVDRNCPEFVETIRFTGAVRGDTLVIRETARESQAPDFIGALRWQPPVEYPATIRP
jgi:hypothetical protein